MDFSLSQALIKVGAVYLIYKVEFPQKIKSKYIIVLEDFCNTSDDIICVLTTSNLDHHYRLSSVKVDYSEDSVFPETTLIECDNYWVIPIHILMNPEKSRYIGNVGQDIVEQIYDAFTHVREIPTELLIRIFPE